MIVYVGAGSGAFRDLVLEAGHGQIVSRQAWAFRVPKKGRWAFDNGAYTDWKNGEPFDNEEFLRRVRQVADLPEERLPDWCVCPDVVGTETSLLYSLRWRSMLRDYAPQLKWYLALQDYVHPDDVGHALCLEHFDGLFVGGTTEWKLDTSSAWVEWGHRRGLPVHVARVNGPNRLRWAVTIKADSVDGTGWVHAGARWLPHLQELPEPEREGLFPARTGFPAEWIRFGAWLRDIWTTPADWKARLESDEELWEFSQSIWALSPQEFAEWFSRAYGMPLKVPKGGFDTPKEYKEWAWDNLAQAEHYLGPRPPPPLPPPAKFAVDECGLARPLAEMPPGRERWCENTKRWLYDVLGPGGMIIKTYDIVLAAAIEEAEKRATQENPPAIRRMRCPTITKGKREP